MSDDRLDILGVENRLLDQYRDSDDLRSLLTALIDGPRASVQDALIALRSRLDIDAMTGVQLDGIGSIIGRPRPFVLDFAEAGTAFEFTQTDGVAWIMGAGVWDDSLLWDDSATWRDDSLSVPEKGFSSLQAPDSGGRFASLGTNTPMSDADYRVLLKATILRNTTAATVPDLEAYGEALIGAPVRVVNSLYEITIEIAGRLSPVLRGVVQDSMQAAAGIRIAAFTYGVAADAFRFDSNGTGFGQIGTAQTGSGFARLLQS